MIHIEAHKNNIYIGGSLRSTDKDLLSKTLDITPEIHAHPKTYINASHLNTKIIRQWKISFNTSIEGLIQIPYWNR